MMKEFEKSQGVQVPEDIQRKIAETIHGETLREKSRKVNIQDKPLLPTFLNWK